MPKKSPVRIIAVAIRSREDAARVARETVTLQLDREKLIADRDAAVLAASEPFTGEIDTIGRQLDEKMAVLEQWANANPEEFGDARSIKLDGHSLGWRLGSHATKLLKGWTWAKVVAKLQDSKKALRDRFVRIKTEANKEAMIEARAHDKLLARFGVEIVQGETFYLDPNREGQPATKLEADRTEVAA